MKGKFAEDFQKMLYFLFLTVSFMGHIECKGRKKFILCKKNLKKLFENVYTVGNVPG